MWLLGRLIPDHKTIADFRKDNWTLNELQVPYERVDAGMAFGIVNEPFYKKMNPNSRVPTIDDEKRVPAT